MVEVTKSNFEMLMPEIKSKINDASFVALDAEFSGLSTTSKNCVSLFDSMKTRYSKLKDFASNFVICQFGMTIFSKHENKNMYQATTYTFYLCPHQCGSNDRRFLWQASSVQFLSKYNFDFNKVAYEGIPYLNEVEEATARSELLNNSFCNYHFENLQSRKYDPELVEFAENAKEGEEIIVERDKNDHEYIQLKFLRLMYPETWSFQENNQIYMQKVSKEKRKELEETTPEEEEKLLDFHIGFSHIFKVLQNANKPIVGHNCLLDIFLIYNNFYRPLPDTLKEFKENFRKLFSIVYDTKHIWLNMKKYYTIKNVSRLSELYFLYDIFQNPSQEFITLFSPCVFHELYDKSGQILKHNAGYDSYVTGFVFLKLCHVFAMKKTKSLVQVVPQTFKQHMKMMEPFANKINITQAKIHFLDLAGFDLSSHRPDTLYVKMKGTHHCNIDKVAQKIACYGYIEIQQISQTEALVAVSSFGCAKEILTKLKNDSEFTIVPYNFVLHTLLLKYTSWFIRLGVPAICSFIIYKFFYRKL